MTSTISNGGGYKTPYLGMNGVQMLTNRHYIGAGSMGVTLDAGPV